MADNLTSDIVSFINNVYPVDSGRVIIPPFLETWLYTAFPKPAGNPTARNILHSTSKKQGKSTLAGAVGLYMASRSRNNEVIIAAADKDQARDRVFRSIRYAVENHPVWSRSRIYTDTIELDNGSIIQAIPFDWRGAAGGNYSAVIMDELHTYTSEAHRRLYDELVIPPTRPEGVRWIASYAGFLGESVLLWDVWNKAQAGERIAGDLPIYRNPGAGLLALIDQGESSWRMPWMSAEYIAEIQTSERPNTYRRLWLNEWVSQESQFIDPERWEGCYSGDIRPISPGDRRRVVFGADASTARDFTALVGVDYDRDKQQAEVVYCHVWKPGRSIFRSKPTVDLSETIGAEILRLYKAGNIAAVFYDPYQLHSIAIDLQRAGVRMIELPQTGARIEADQALYDAIIGGAIKHYGDPVLDEHIKNAIAIETARGFRLAKEKTTRKIDAAVALSMAHYGAMQELKANGEARAIPNIFFDWEGASQEDFLEIGGKWFYLPERARDAHPPGVTYRNCKNRNKGCEACVAELELEGWYAAQDATAAEITPMSEAQFMQDWRFGLDPI